MKHLELCVMVVSAVVFYAGPAMALGMQALTQEHRVWQPSEFVLADIPAAQNPYDPHEIAVDVTFTGPSGATVSRPAFWYQGYTRSRENDTEVLMADGAAGWRVRFTPLEAGTHTYRIVVQEKGGETQTAEGAFEVGAKQADAHGFARIEPTQKRYFMFEDGTPLPLVGECVCWHHGPGTFNYDEWFDAFEKSGMNYTRLWMWNVSFGIEFLKEERLNYNQERAWRLDYVLDLAAQKGIYVMLCLDYHGIFVVEKDHWGGNNWWPEHPYNAAQGGPCATQNDFFTDEAAKALYRKRLRYLVGRYGAQPSLMAWEFFNEINIPLKYLKVNDVVAWHDEMAQWLHGHDPYRRPISTSLSSPAELAKLWRLDSIDFSQYHLYLNADRLDQNPATVIAGLAERFHTAYGKPLLIGEYGTSWKGFSLEEDPHRRGVHQGVWGGLLGGSAGTAMSWWWESIHAENLYPFWAALGHFIDGTGFGSAAWRPASVAAADQEPAVDAFCMTDGCMALVWVLDSRYAYPKRAGDPAERHPGVELAIDGMPDGVYDVQWWDTRAGNVLEAARAESRESQLRLRVVPFDVDIAARIIPAGP